MVKYFVVSALRLHKAGVFAETAQTETAHFLKCSPGWISLKTHACPASCKHRNIEQQTDNFGKTSLQTVFEAGLFYDWLNSLEAVALVIIKGVCVYY